MKDNAFLIIIVAAAAALVYFLLKKKDSDKEQSGSTASSSPASTPMNGWPPPSLTLEEQYKDSVSIVPSAPEPLVGVSATKAAKFDTAVKAAPVSSATLDALAAIKQYGVSTPAPAASVDLVNSMTPQAFTLN